MEADMNMDEGASAGPSRNAGGVYGYVPSQHSALRSLLAKEAAALPLPFQQAEGPGRN